MGDGRMSFSERISQFLTIASRRGDLVIALIVLVAIAMMIIPLPTWLVDILITINMAASMLVLLVAFSVVRPIEFSALPSVILMATLFRLAITITTTRLILLQADAGEIILAFGNFVVGGMVVVGLIIFLIITIAQFLVITKGAERVAEVAARFTLDALPGKQMSIDSDLRNGDIDKEEARRQRSLLERESQLYGAMDGAMKFVKGDAIASLVIVVVNLIGGLLVGTLTKGMTLTDAVTTYSLLSVGDGLVAQIPALLISVGAGTVITRVESETRSDLGGDIARQLTDPRALLLGAPIMLLLALVPGFPSYIFLAMGLMFGAGGYMIYKRQRPLAIEAGRPAAPAAARVAAGAATAAAPLPSGPATPAKMKAAVRERAEAIYRPAHGITVWVGENLETRVRPSVFLTRADETKAKLQDDLGVEAPPVSLFPDPTIGANHFRIDLEGVPVMEGDIPANSFLVDDETVHLDIAGIPYIAGPPLGGFRRSIWVDSTYETSLEDTGVRFLSPLDVLSSCLTFMFKRYVAQFLGVQEARKLLDQVEKEVPDLVKEVQKISSLQKMAEIMRRLVEENVPMRNLRPVLEAVVEWGQREEDPVLLVEYVRTGLARQICYRCADANRVIAAFVLERSLEEMLRASVRPTGVGAFLAISEDVARSLLDRLRTHTTEVPPDVQAVVLTTMDLRRHVRNLLVRNNIDLPVLSYQELAPEFGVQALAVIQAEPEAEEPAGRQWEHAAAGAI
jgi:type III secretion protein V